MNSRSASLFWIMSSTWAEWLTNVSKMSFGIITAGWPMTAYWSSYFEITWAKVRW